MKKNKTKHWLGIAVIGITLGLALQFARAWTEPSTAPPGGNVGAPINTGANVQDKGDSTHNGDICVWQNGVRKCLSASLSGSWRLAQPGCGSGIVQATACRTVACNEVYEMQGFNNCYTTSGGGCNGNSLAYATYYLNCAGTSCANRYPQSCTTTAL